MNTIALSIHVCIDDWAAKSAIKASNASRSKLMRYKGHFSYKEYILDKKCSLFGHGC